MSWKIWQEQRHILVFLISVGVFILYVCRVNLSVAIVAMTIDMYETLENGTVIKHVSVFFVEKLLFLICSLKKVDISEHTTYFQCV